MHSNFLPSHQEQRWFGQLFFLCLHTQLLPEWHDLSPGVQHDAALEDVRLGLLQMAQAFEVLAVHCGAGLDFDAGLRAIVPERQTLSRRRLASPMSV